MDSKVVFVEVVTSQRNKEDLALLFFKFLSKLSERQASREHHPPESPQTNRNAVLIH